MSDIWWIVGAPLFAALMCFSAIWPLSVRWRDVSIVDSLWGPGFFGQLCVAWLLIPRVGIHGIVVFGLIAIWSFRLTWVLLRRRVREGEEDARYQMIRASWGPSFWWKSLFIIFVLQAFIQWTIVLGPILVLTADPAPMGVLMWIGIAIALSGLVLETIADRELDKFKETAVCGDLCTTGLRAHVRHPNYLGEITFWCGIATIAIDALAWWGLLSPALLILFLTRISGAPLIDERLRLTRPAYPSYRARVPAFIPRFKSRAEKRLPGQ